jgi:hypothetical protein
VGEVGNYAYFLLHRWTYNKLKKKAEKKKKPKHPVKK